MEKKPLVMLVTALKLPVPAIKGGAIETLITSIINQNELYGKIDLIVTSIYDDCAAKHRYDHAEIVYYDSNGNAEKLKHPRVKFFFYKFFCRIFRNVIIRKLFSIDFPNMDYVTYEHYLLAKQKKVDVIVDEGCCNRQFGNFIKLVGCDNIYYHIHFTQNEILNYRNIIRNSISISDFVRTAWVKDKTIPGENTVLYNGINLTLFNKSFSMEKKKAFRSRLGICEGDFVVVFCGRIMPEKGIEQLLMAFEILENEHTNIRLLLIGSFDNIRVRDKEFSQRMKQKAETMSNVILTGYVPNSELSNYYAISDIQIVPSVWQEGAGLVAIEGMAMGLPLIVTESGGMTEYVTEETAITIPINDDLPDNIVLSILRLYGDSELCLLMGNAGRKRAQYFSEKYYYNNFVKIVTREIEKN